MSTKPVQVGIVNYLNTLPLRHGLEVLAQMGSITLYQDYPSKIAAALQTNEIELGLVPVAAMLTMPNAHIVGTHCISADGVVASVALFSQVPLAEIKTVYLDYQSKTSVRLVKILCRDYWHIDVQFVDAPQNFIDQVQGTTAAVIIGDRALQHKLQFTYEYDLADAWKQHTGLPFVFAVWLSTTAMSADFIAAFDAAQQQGIACIDEVVAANPYSHYSLEKYLKHNIQFTLSAEKFESINLFLKTQI
jgi:chorismate dehydratase